jgi:chemotaxis protein histidine kinase CheA
MGGLDHCDPAMLELFRAEIDTHMPVLSQGLLALEKGGGGEKEFEAMMRAAHSIKGAARIVGIETAVRIAHAIEDCFSTAKGQCAALTSDAVDVLLQGVDALQRAASLDPDPSMSEQAVQSLIDQLTATREGGARRPRGPSVQDSPVSRCAVQPAGSASALPEAHLVLPATLDAGSVAWVREEFLEILRREPNRIRLDFSGVSVISVEGLSLLVSLARQIAGMDPAIGIDGEGISAPVGILLRATGLDGAFRRNG